MATPAYVSAGSVTRGIPLVQTGVNLESHRERFENPKDYILDIFGGRTGFAYNFDESSTLTLAGETNTATPQLALGVAYGTALTVANQVDGFGVASGGYYLDDIEINLARESKAAVTANLTRIEGIT